LSSDQRVGGSSPSERTNVYKGLTESGDALICLSHTESSQHESGRPKPLNGVPIEPPSLKTNLSLLFEASRAIGIHSDNDFGGFTFDASDFDFVACSRRLSC